MVLVIAVAMLGGGCADETTVNLPEGTAPAPTEEVRTCPEYNLAEIACTVETPDADQMPLMAPYIVAGRLYKYATAAVLQCYTYEKVSWCYTEAMRQLNAGRDPDTVEKWFRNVMRDYAGYDPTVTCPGGCDV